MGCCRRACTRLHLELSQGLKRTPCLGAPIGFECPQVAAHAQLPPMLIDHAQVHEQVRAEHVQFKVCALHIQAGDVPNFLEECIR